MREIAQEAGLWPSSQKAKTEEGPIDLKIVRIARFRRVFRRIGKGKARLIEFKSEAPKW